MRSYARKAVKSGLNISVDLWWMEGGVHIRALSHSGDLQQAAHSSTALFIYLFYHGFYEFVAEDKTRWPTGPRIFTWGIWDGAIHMERLFFNVFARFLLWSIMLTPGGHTSTQHYKVATDV